jgi:hypothetical protein
MDKKDGLKRISCVNKELLFGEKKILLKPRLGLVNIIRTLHQGNQPLRCGLLNLNGAK